MHELETVEELLAEQLDRVSGGLEHQLDPDG